MNQFTNSLPKSLPACNTVVELLNCRTHQQPNADAFTFLEDGESVETKFTYRELDRRSRQIAAQLQGLGLKGERALLLYPSGLDYLAAFFGCLYAGVIAVPAYPPQNQRRTPRIRSIVADAQPAIALTTELLLPKMESLLGTIGNLQWLATDNLKVGREANWQQPILERDSIAFLQYTSGSTGIPKGVMVSHGNILHNAAMTYRWMGHSPESVFVSWLPIYHDMGLIGGILQPLYGGFPCILMSPTSFLQRPYRWLQAISRYRGTTSGAPNFAYELCSQKITPEQRATLDLSNWQVAFNGAEPIRGETLEFFATTFADCGFRQSAFYPCYGMAETTLLVSGGDRDTGYKTQAVDKLALAEDKIVEASGEKDSKVLVGCGKSIPDLEIAIVNPETFTVCSTEEVGEIWVRGDSVAQGYWNRPEETKETFQVETIPPSPPRIPLRLSATRVRSPYEGGKDFLRTGDLGFLDEAGELFITGRLKDLIIIRGRNLYPQDIELTTERSHDALRLGSNAAFTVEVDNEERLVVVQELEFRAKPNFEEVIVAIRQEVTETHEIEVYGVVLIKPGSIPKTSSGKIQRRATRDLFIEKTLKIVSDSILETKEFIDRQPKLTRTELLQHSPQKAQLLLEAYVQTEIARILKRLPEEVEINSPLTSLGLDSLKVFELKNQIESDLGVDIAIADLFSGLTMRSLATKILAQLEVAKDLESIPLQRINTGNNIHPVSLAQARLWFLDRLKAGNAYNISFAVRIEGNLDVEHLEECIEGVISRQEILRTSFRTLDGKPVQVIHPDLAVALEIVDVSKSNVGEIATKEHQQAFDLTKLPLLRLQLLQLSSAEYILLLTMHHIIADGLSAEVFMTEVARRYQGLAIRDLAVQYKDVVYWQNRILERDSQAHLDYWRAKLKDAPPLLQLPTDRSRPAVQSYQGKSQSWEIPEHLTKQLQDLAQNEGATLFMLLLAAFKTLLYRYTGQEDIIVGSPIANRDREQVQELIGFFVNTLVLRINLAENPNFLKLLSQVRQVALEAYAHQDLPFDKLVEALQPVRDLSYTPLFQVMFAMQNAPQLTEIPGLTLSEFKVDPQIAQFDLSVSIENADNNLIATFEYNTDLFDDATITRMGSHYQNLLAGIVINPQARLSDLPLLSNAEKQQLLIDWNPIAIDTAEDLSIHQLFEQQVTKTPDAVAIIAEREQLTYQELNQRAELLAIYLQSIGVKPEVIVGIYLERSPDVIVAILGILKAGGAYLPLDPAHPQERIDLIIKDARISIVLTQQHLKAKLSQQPLKAIAIDTEWSSINQQHDKHLERHVRGNNLAYVIYTSGSTGKPKGVAISHRSLVNFVRAATQEYQITLEDRILQFATISFDASVEEIYSCLISGSTLVLRTAEMGYSPSLLLQKCREYGITILDLPTAFWHLLTTELENNSTLEFPPLIRLVIIGGETVSLDKVTSWNRLVGKTCQLINTYGPTETTVVATSYKIPDRLDGLSSIPIGKPLPNTRVYILDKNFQPVPIGVWGEIYLGGVSLAREYLNNPQLTQERFVSILSQSLLYKTGDIARYLPNGNIEFLGRIDNQVKIRGFRIELTEIEAVIKQYQNIKQAVVITQTNKQNIIAYLVLNEPENQEKLIERLRNYLKQNLPDYMMPSDWQILTRLPLTNNGKIDRQALEKIQLQSEQKANPAIALPSNKQERAIALIWQEVLQRENIALDDNFFDVGGHSLLLAQVQEKLEKTLSIDLAITDLFQYPTINSLANHLDSIETNSFSKSNSSQNLNNHIEKQKAAIARKKQLKRSKRRR